MMNIIKLQNKNENLLTFTISVKGIVQGVGFRPFIWRIANESGLAGTVTNTTEGVLISINVKDRSHAIDFIEVIKRKKPSPALIEDICLRQVEYSEYNGFSISKSIETENKFQLISPDLATCSNCIEDILDKRDTRRYSYPFTNCTNCGPRFTIIEKMPYDRNNTTMKKFKMCPDCMREYNDAKDRRFHAQPNACNHCGPKLILTDNLGKIKEAADPILNASKLLLGGKIVGIKSLGGFQIACDATNDMAVSLLRKRKKRPSKPFALMFKNTGMASKYCMLNKKEIESMNSPSAPVVLVKKIKKTGIKMISYGVSGFNKYEGAMIAYTPLHHLLFNKIDVPLIMTSGNLSEEPIVSDNTEAIQRLGNICDYFLLHDRDIFSKYDDSVIKISASKEMVIRRARGFAPYPVKVEQNNNKKVILAMGAQEKNTFCLQVKNFAILSQHIGDLDSVESFDFFEDTLKNHKRIFGIGQIDCIAYDSHPEYASSRMAKESMPDAAKIEVQHHKAHIASVIAENGLLNKIDKKIIGFAWDGTGYGDDGKIWGSEVFTIDSSLQFERICHLTEKTLPGGEITIKKPYRMSLVYLYELWKKNPGTGTARTKKFIDYIYNGFPFYRKLINAEEILLIQKQIDTGFNSPVTTSMGRFFDAVSSILELTHVSSYEGEAAIHLEMIAKQSCREEYNLRFIKGKNTLLIDDFFIFRQILQDLENGIPSGNISAKFHNSLARVIVSTCLKQSEKSGVDTVALSGGVFQNNLLFSKTSRLLKKHYFKVYSNFKVPVNDGGISLGQAYIASKHLF